MNMKCIDEIPASELKGKRVFLRTILNLPLNADGSVGDVFRLKRGFPTIDYLVKNGARVVIAGYFGRTGESMRPVAEALQGLAPHVKMYFFGTPFSEAPQQAGALKDGECLILENPRRDPGEESNDPEFVKLLARTAEIFVGDSLPDAHRTYASSVGVAKLLPSYAGFLMRDEVKNLLGARSPARPSFAILGGAKFETKAPLIRTLLAAYNHLFIVGALANDVFKARGYPVGRSLISKEQPDKDVLEHPHFLAPVDVTVERSDGQVRVKKPQEVEADDKIVDIGPESVAMVAPLIAQAKSVLWSGPTGMYEKGYIHYTRAIAELLEKSDARKVIGGGDTIAAIEASGVKQDKLGFLSTGGGAMLEYLLKGTLPGIEVLN
ncbi:phosphoglycerate kinase [Candidatus Kaiserbacteria bacterium RIFCSPHIGHO2_12_FULL_53_13]|uniref:Phosphoglycerate kinase n=1 Tax=Candidatus Kaiserbacteria bacterium RIFCSPHIGHO2_12_FULL_53_13 TaxID=1798502 RepID=A0A1F6EC06_9BACT|nr:MAG: phosphoglycerate kinase [Candidatus Kaiserbacteria bacterium RIFCSPHIGHO2_12_FULL_53_13]